ncbi:MAG: hypothetical protein ACREA0_03410, partial [bacterium]
MSSHSTDAMGRQWRSCGPDGVCIEDQYTDGLLVTRTRFAGPGAARTVTPGLAQGTKYFQYHPSSLRILEEWDWIGSSEILSGCRGGVPDNCNVPHIERTWTAAGRPDTVLDTQGNLTSYGYDVAGKSLLPTRVSREGLTSQLFGYDATYPLLVTRRTVDQAHVAPDIVETTTWDRNLRPSGISRSNGSSITEAVMLNYDAAG